MRLAYIILAHRLPDQVARLVERLDDEGVTFVVHVGRASPDILEPLRRRLAERPNVRFVRRHRVRWCNWSLMRAHLKGVAELIEGGVAFDYAFNLSGQDYPLRANAEIRAFLEAQEGRSFLDHMPLPSSRPSPGGLDWSNQDGGLDRLRHWHLARYKRWLVKFPNRRVPFPPHRRLPPGPAAHGGQAWWCLSRACVERLHASLGERPDVVRFFRWADCPEELLPHTMLMSSPLADTIDPDDLRTLIWQPGSSSPKTLTSADWDVLASSPDLFARKFDVTVDPSVLDRIDTDLLAAAPRERGTVGPR